ncbi:MAG: tRNA lysidine(34) synthetase TilS [Bacteroidota bacterium]
MNSAILPFIHHLQQWFESQEIDLENNRFLIAVSGGPDSVLLAYLMTQLKAEFGLAHVNYQLRDEDSQLDQELVEELGEKLGCEVHVHLSTKEEVKNDPFASTQEKARDIRYHFFEELMDVHDYQFCLTAHHGDDQVESILFHLFRGNNVSVIKGIPERREPYLRPLLTFTKDEILKACEELGLSFRIDHTNLQNDYIRNQIRNLIVPPIREVNPSITRQMSRIHQWYGLKESFISHVMSNLYPFMIQQHAQGATLDWQPFLELYSEEYLPLLVAEVLTKWGIHGHTMQQALRLIHSSSGKYVEWHDRKIYRTRVGIAYSEEDYTKTFQDIEVEDLPESTLQYNWMGRDILLDYHEGEAVFGKINDYYLDADEIKWPIKIRSWKLGDRMMPLGMSKSKKLSDIFIDAKMNPLQKERAIVIEDQQKIICLSDFRPSESVKITEDTWHILRIRFQEKG